MLNMIKSIYSCIKSRIKHDNALSEPFTYNIGVRHLKGLAGINIGMIKYISVCR